MSFQGDVRGIGLAELLQGLARGRKEGVLTLTAKSGLRSTLGLDGGALHLLPEPNEEAEYWRDRVRSAWSDDPEFRIDYLRMAEIARADRLERLFKLLDGEGVHFRFDPGPLPNQATGGVDTGPEEGRRTEVYCEAVPVEFLLLEYARIGDELGEFGEHGTDIDQVPIVLDPNANADGGNRFLGACNGNSTLLEIADRMSWPVRQAALYALQNMRAGVVRFAGAGELMNLALFELGRKNFARAANRLQSWCRTAYPGPVQPQEAEALANEWLAGRLPAALSVMAPASVRTILRRLDHAMQNPSAAAVHWNEAYRLFPSDRVVRLHRMACEYREGGDPEVPSLREVLEVAREFRDAGQPLRSGPVLVMGIELQPSGAAQQLELGQGLVLAGLAQDAGPWILAAANELLDQGSADRALVALRMLVEADPTNRECRQLLSRARRSSTHVKKLRKHLLVGLATVAAVSLGAAVKMRAESQFHARVAEVRDLVATPSIARAKLEQYFPSDRTPLVAKLAAEILERERTDEQAIRAEWLDLYVAAQSECTIGDPSRGLKLALGLPEPPRLRLIKEPWPLQRDLLTGAAENIAAQLEELGPPVVGSTQQVSGERRVSHQVRAMQRELEEADMTIEVGELLEILVEFEQQLADRKLQREDQIKRALERELMTQQNELLVKAQQHARNGDYARAIRDYEELVRKDTSGKVEPVLAEEIATVKDKHEAVQEARSLCAEGKHDEAYEILTARLERPDDFLMPWKVDSFPHGLQAVLESGSPRTTPFAIETTFGDETRMVFQLEGFDDLEVSFDGPADRFVYMSRTADREWSGDGRVDALPVAFEDDHVVVDRKGTIARIRAHGERVWQNQILTLSGIARSPVALPGRPGFLLVVTEDGAAWIVDAENGTVEGSWELESAPVSGPYSDGEEVRLLMKNGRVAAWKTRLKPRIGSRSSPDEFEANVRYGAHSGLEVLRYRSDMQSKLTSIWNDWSVSVDADVFHAYRDGMESEGYTVTRTGDWEYVAWEAPRQELPDGRLWISDGRGLRAFVPPPPAR